jgi:Conserved nitrate reductase-associated protein (Nitr_red_assoc).
MNHLGLAPLTLSQWQNLEELQRCVLIKLTSPHHQNRNFIPALVEFNLLDKGRI